MNSIKAKVKVPEIKTGNVVEIFACGGQCRGKSHIAVYNPAETTIVLKKLKKVG